MQEKLSAEEKRKMRIARSNPREGYRNFSPKRYPYFLIVFWDIFTTIWISAILILIATPPFLWIYSFARWADILTKTVGGILISVAVLRVLLRNPVKRFFFVLRLKRFCKRNGLKIFMGTSLFRHVFSVGKGSDLLIESANVKYEIKLLPARRKYIKFYFYKNGLLICESGLLKLRFLAPWQRPHYSRHFYGFDSRTDAKKILLFNPVPFEFYYWNTETSRLTFGGNGDSFFGYTAYTGTGFINMLSRTK